MPLAVLRVRDSHAMVHAPGMPSCISINELDLHRDPITRIEDGAVLHWWHDSGYRCNVYVRDIFTDADHDPDREVCIYGRKTMPPIAVGEAMAEVFMPDTSTVGEYIMLWDNRPPAIFIRKVNGMTGRQVQC